METLQTEGVRMPSYAADRPWPGASSWSTALTRDALHALAKASRGLVGYRYCVINVIHRDRFRVVAVSGDERTRKALMDSEVEATVMLYELTRADRWGKRFRFVPGERAGRGRAWGWTADEEKMPVPNAWDPEDLLVAPLYDGEGEMIGMLSVDGPVTGVRSGPESYAALDEYAEQVELSLRIALERDAADERDRLGSVVRTIVRTATNSVSIPDIWSNCRGPLLRGFAARELWVHQLLGEERFSQGHPFTDVPALHEASREVAEKLWAGQSVRTLGMGKESPEYAALARDEKVVEAIRVHDADRLLVVPLGSSEECVGLVTLVRGRTDPPWSTIEQSMALRMGNDLGHAIVTSWATEQREQLVMMLRETNDSKENIVAMLTHELKSPITVLRAHLETMEEPGAQQMPHALPAMSRAVSRLSRMVDDLLLLTRLRSSATPAPQSPVDLTEIAAQCVAEYADVAAVNGLTMHLDTEEDDPGSWWAWANPADLRVVLSNLVSNAIKYTPHDGEVRLSVGRGAPGEVFFECRDNGIGIDADDLTGLFDEFVRSEDPRARSQPGAGLGLSIVERIVHLNGGRIEIDSELDRGSTFRVILPSHEVGFGQD